MLGLGDFDEAFAIDGNAKVFGGPALGVEGVGWHELILVILLIHCMGNIVS